MSFWSYLCISIVSQKFVIFSVIGSVTLTDGGLDNAGHYPVGPLPRYHITRCLLCDTWVRDPPGIGCHNIGHCLIELMIRAVTSLCQKTLFSFELPIHKRRRQLIWFHKGGVSSVEVKRNSFSLIICSQHKLKRSSLYAILV